MNSDLIGTFEGVDRNQWLALIEKELKGKSADAVNWRISDDWVVPPFSLAGETSGAHRGGKKAVGGWLIGENLSGEYDSEEVSRRVQLAAQGGVQVLRVGETVPAFLPESPNNALALLFEGSPEQIDRLPEWISRYRIEGGALSKQPSEAQLENWSGQWPGSRWLTLDVRCEAPHDHPEYVIEQLTNLLVKGHQLLGLYGGLSTEFLNSQFRFCLSVGNSFYVEIAKLRALRTLWANMLKAWGLPEPCHVPIVEVHAAPDALTQNQHLNMIRLTVQALSAVVGGCDLLILPAADLQEQGKGSDAGTRISRNIQHLLRLESHLDAVEDPAGGSYSLDNLTDSVTERVWSAFVATQTG